MLALIAAAALSAPSLARAAEPQGGPDRSESAPEEPRWEMPEFRGFSPDSLYWGPGIAYVRPLKAGQRPEMLRTSLAGGTMLWIEEDWHLSLALDTYLDMPLIEEKHPPLGGGSDVLLDAVWKVLWLRGGTGMRSFAFDVDPARRELGVGGRIGGGLAMWIFRLGVEYDGRQSVRRAEQRHSLLFNLSFDTRPNMLDRSGRGGGNGGIFGAFMQ